MYRNLFSRSRHCDKKRTLRLYVQCKHTPIKIYTVRLPVPRSHTLYSYAAKKMFEILFDPLSVLRV